MHGHIPDETYLQTVLYNTPGLTVTKQLVTYVPERPAHTTPTRWMVLDESLLPQVWESGAAFARKVDPVTQPQIIKTLDERVDRQRGTHMPPDAEGPLA